MPQQNRQNTQNKQGPAAPSAPPEDADKSDAPEPDTGSTGSTGSTESTEPQGHVVLVDMLTYKVKGRKPHSVVSGRTRKGGLVVLDPELNDIDKLVALKAISPDDGQAKRRTTAKALASAIGGLDDPVKVPDNLFDVTGEDVTPPEASDNDVTPPEASDNDDEDEDTSTPADDD